MPTLQRSSCNLFWGVQDKEKAIPDCDCRSNDNQADGRTFSVSLNKKKKGLPIPIWHPVTCTWNWERKVWRNPEAPQNTVGSFEWARTGSDVLNWSILTKICSGEHKVVKYYFSDLLIWRNCNKIEAVRSALPGKEHSDRGYGCCTAHQATDNSYGCLEEGRQENPHGSGFLIIP